MDRRAFLRVGTAASAAGAGLLAGCSGLFSVQTGYQERMPPLPENRPAAVYYPSHIEGMEMVGMKTVGGNDSGSMGTTNGTALDGAKSDGTSRSNDSGGDSGTAGGYRCALTYSYPHRFWTVTGTETEKVSIGDNDSLHLMVSVWDPATGVFPMDTNPTITISQNGDSVTTVSPWTMLSQNMGFHTGDNISLPGAGDYTVTVDVPPTSVRRTGSFDGRFDSQQSVEFPFTFDPDKVGDIMFKELDEKAGTRGAVEPMEMKKMPLALAPKKGELPGRPLGTVRTGDAVFAVRALSDASRFGGDEKTYLAVSARTPHNRYVLPAMSLSATVARGNETVFDGALQATLDPALNYHYGASVESIESGDEIDIVVDAPPQVARHEGYETAFLKMPSRTLTVGDGSGGQ
jgi:hypothetical protein